MDVQKILARRQELAGNMAKNGFSCYEIARYFEISPHIVKKTLERMGVEVKEQTEGRAAGKFALILNKRQEDYINLPEEQFNIKHGFLQYRDTINLHSVIKNPYFPELPGNADYMFFFMKKFNDDDEKWIYNTKPTEENGLKITKKIIERGRKYREFEKNVNLVTELFADGWTSRDVSVYAGIEDPGKLMYLIKESGQAPARRTTDSHVLEALEAGLLSLDTVFLTGIKNNGSKEETDNIVRFRAEHGLKSKNPNREHRDEQINRELGERFFMEYTAKNGPTQKEIAEKHGMKRSEVNKAINDYKRAHPDKALQERVTTLSRRRNVAKPLRDLKEERTNLIIRAYNEDKKAGKPLSFASIERRTKIPAATVAKILEENGLYTGRFHQAAEKLKQTRHGEMVEAAIGMTTSEIMAERFPDKDNYVGDNSPESLNKRYTVLNDQHITRNFLNNNPVARERVIKAKGMLTRNEMLENVEEDMEQEIS